MFHLVLSDKIKFWEKSSKNIYLGPWIKSDILKENYSKYHVIIPDWHWDNIDKYSKDSIKHLQTYEKFIVKLAEVMNEIHDLNWRLKSWKILVGPWLNRYLAVLLDRSETIEAIFNSYDLKSCNTKDLPITDLQFKDFEEFSDAYKKEHFNILIYSHILRKLDKEKKIIFKELKFEKINTLNNKNNKNISLKKILKESIIKTYNFLFSFFLKKNTYYFQNIYLKNRYEYIRLNLKLKNFPHFRIINLKVEDKTKFDKNLRDKFLEKVSKKFNPDEKNLFNELFVELIYNMFPRCYLENFKINDKKAQNSFKSINSKIIIDGNSYHKDEIFKFWLARKIQNNAKIILLQHGGYYENFKIKGDFLDHELDISDKYLSWGWKKESFNITPIPCNLSFDRKKINKNKFLVNLILNPIKTYTTDITSSSTPHKAGEKYINDIIEIANSLNKNMSLRIFLHPNSDGNDEYGFQMKSYLKKKITNNKVKFFYGGIKKYINSTDINIFTYLGTPYNQAISSDIPSILYVNEFFQPLNDDYRFVYDLMIKSKLMHNEVSTIIAHLSSINYEVYNWWNERNTIKSKDIFCNNFAKKSYTTEKLKEAILTIN